MLYYYVASKATNLCIVSGEIHQDLKCASSSFRAINQSCSNRSCVQIILLFHKILFLTYQTENITLLYSSPNKQQLQFKTPAFLLTVSYGLRYVVQPKSKESDIQNQLLSVRKVGDTSMYTLN